MQIVSSCAKTAFTNLKKKFIINKAKCYYESLQTRSIIFFGPSKLHSCKFIIFHIFQYIGKSIGN